MIVRVDHPVLGERLVAVDRNPWYWWPKWYGIAPGDSEFTSAFTLRGLLRKLEQA